MFAMAKHFIKYKKDIVDSYFIKNDAVEIVKEESGIQELWRKCFCALLNEDNPNVIQEEYFVERPVTDISQEKMEQTFRSIKANKGPGLSGVTTLTSDLLKVAGRNGVTQITIIFQQIMH